MGDEERNSYSVGLQGRQGMRRLVGVGEGSLRGCWEDDGRGPSSAQSGVLEGVSTTSARVNEVLTHRKGERPSD